MVAWKVLGQGRKAPQGSHTAEGGYVTLFSKWSHSRPHKTAPPSHQRACLRWKLRGRHKAQIPHQPPLPPHMPRSTEHTRCSHSQAPTPMWLGGLQCSTAIYWGFGPAPDTEALLLRCWQLARASVPTVGMPNP